MNVNATQGMGQMMQTRKMDGSGEGMRKGQGGQDSQMMEIMQNLSSEDRGTLKDAMQSLSKEDRAAAKEQMGQIDPANMTSSEYFEALLEVFEKQNQTEATLSDFSSLYA